jgi:hypothetical protein
LRCLPEKKSTPQEKKNLVVRRFAPFVDEEITCIKAGGKRAGGNVPMRVAGCMENLSRLPVMDQEGNHHG